MNTSSHSTDVSAPATPNNMRDFFDGMPGTPGIYDLSARLRHQLHYLVDDLEHCFKRGRALEASGRSLTFMFDQHGIDATLWLASEAFIAAADLCEAVRDAERHLEEKGE